MGYARIVSGGDDGRYVIEIDQGLATKTAALSALSLILAQLDVNLATQQAIVDEADAREAIARQQLDDAVDQYAAALQAGEATAEDATLVSFYVNRLRKIEIEHLPARRALALFKLDRTTTLGRIAYWNQFQPVSQRPAWCADLTESIAPDSIVATCEIPGDTNLVLVAPSGRAWSPADGYIQGREVCSPAQSFFNAAIFPGWQKFKPTYRWGTATAIDYEADTMDVDLEPATSSAQGLSVNQSSSLSAVQVQYMTCNAAAFEVGDRVIVQFVGQAWDEPRVIGFVDNPKPCEPWPDVLLDVYPLQSTVVTPSPGTRGWIASIVDSSFGCGPEHSGFQATESEIRSHQTRIENARFEDLTAESKGFEIVEGDTPVVVDWGQSTFVGVGTLPAGASPAVTIGLVSGDVVRDERPFTIESGTGFFNNPPDGPFCVPVDPVEGGYWSLRDGFPEVNPVENFTRTVLGTVGDLVPTIRVGRLGMTRTYVQAGVTGVSPSVYRFVAPP